MNPGKPRKQQTQLKIEQLKNSTAKIKRSISIWTRFFQLLGKIAGFLTVIAVFYIIYLCVVELSGKETHAVFLVNIKTYIETNLGKLIGKIITVLTEAALVIVAFLAIYLKRGEGKRNGAHIKELELRLDPKRSSSGLKDTGETLDGDDIDD